MELYQIEGYLCRRRIKQRKSKCCKKNECFLISAQSGRRHSEREVTPRRHTLGHRCPVPVVRSLFLAGLLGVLQGLIGHIRGIGQLAVLVEIVGDDSQGGHAKIGDDAIVRHWAKVRRSGKKRGRLAKSSIEGRSD